MGWNSVEVNRKNFINLASKKTYNGITLGGAL